MSNVVVVGVVVGSHSVVYRSSLQHYRQAAKCSPLIASGSFNVAAVRYALNKKFTHFLP